MKQNVMKRTLAGVLAVLTVAAYMPANVGGFLTESTGIVMGVSAEEATGLAAAINNGTVKLTADVSLSDTLEITADTTIDLDGHSITADGCRAFHVKSGTLTLTGVGTISSTGNIGAGKSVIRVGDGDTAKEATDDKAAAGLDIGSGVTITSDKCYGVTVFGSKTTETVDVYGKVNVTGTVSAISGNGNSWNSGTTINIYSGAEVSAENGIAIYHPQDGTLNIKGGTVSGKTAVFARAGIVNIEDGQFTGSGAVADPGTVANGADATGDAIVAHAFVDDYVTVPQFKISGGTFTSENANAIGVYKRYEQNPLPTVSVTGGRFISGSQKMDVSAYFDTKTYSQDDYGYVRETAAICWDEIEDATDKTLFRVDPTYLNVYNGKTVKLRKDVETKQIYVPNGYKGSIDLNGHDLDLNGYAIVGYNSTSTNYAELTIKNTGAAATLTGLKSDAQTLNVNDYGKLTIGEKVTVTTEAAWTLVPHENNTINIYGTVANNHNYDGQSDSGYAISGNALWSMGTVINVYDGAVVSAPYGVAIYQPHDGTLNVYGGTVSGLTAIYARTGNINIRGGAFSANGAALPAGTIANGADPTGDTLVFQSWEPSYGVPVARITGGTFDSVNGKTVAGYTYNNSAVPDISISGGTFNTVLDAAYIANGYSQVNGEVKKLEQQDISKFMELKFEGSNSFLYDATEKSVNPIVTVTSGNLEEGTDYVVEGDTSATDVGTYVVKVRGIGNYKGEIKLTWSITNKYDVYVYSEGDYFEPKAYTRSFGQSISVTAPEKVGGMKFSHWESSETGEKLSTSADYSFIVKNPVNLCAKYVAEEQEVKQEAVLSLTTFKSTYNGKHAVGFDFTHSVPTGFKVKEVGLLYGTNKLVGANTSVSGYAKKNLKDATQAASVGVSNLANALKTRSTVKKYVASYKNNNGTLRFSYSLGNANDEAYANAVGYVTYVNDKNETVTVYSDTVAASYSSLE